MAATSSARFNDLIAGLAQLKDEHEHLQAELAQLRQQGPQPVPGAGADAHPEGNADAAALQWTTSESPTLVSKEQQLTRTGSVEAEVAHRRSSDVSCTKSKRSPNANNNSSDHLELKEEWREFDTTADPANLMILSNGRKAAFKKPSTQCSQVEELAGFVVSWLPISPAARFRTTWDIVGVCFLCWDVVNVPLIAFDMGQPLWLKIVDYIILCYWTSDIPLNFVTGYYEREVMVMEWSKIARNYIRTWLFFDLMIVLPDWIVTASGEGDPDGPQRILRGARFMRVLRLLRVVKLQRVMNKIYDVIDNEFTFIAVEVAKMMLSIVVVNHVLACGWFLVGRFADSQGMPTWIDWTENFWDTSVGYQYTTSMHWSLTQFTTASNDVAARNVIERTYSICVLFFGMFAFSTIVGTITASISALRTMSNDKRKSFWMLRRFLKQKGVSKDLTKRMTKFLEHHQEKRERTVAESSVHLLSCISEQLKSELAYEMYGRSLKTHKFFIYVSDVMDVIAFRICDKAVTALSLAWHDILFSIGEEGTKTFITATAGMSYIHPDPSLRENPNLPEGEWLAEAVLWTHWRYHGDCAAAAPCEVLSMDAALFANVMSTQWRPWAYAQAYGQAFIEHLNSVGSKQRSDVIHEVDFDFVGATDQAMRSSNDYAHDDLLGSRLSAPESTRSSAVVAEVSLQGLGTTRQESWSL